MPGDWLLTIARVFFDDAVVSSVITPTVADFRQELLEAESVRAQLAARWHGYAAFWTLVLMSPFAFRDWPGRKQHARSMVVLTIVTIALAIIIGARAQFEDLFRLVLDNVPPETYHALSAAGRWVFLVGPVVIGLLFLRRMWSQRSDWEINAATVLVLGLLSLSVGTVTYSASLCAAFDGIGREGFVRPLQLIGGINGASSTMVVSTVATLLAVTAAAFLVLRQRRAPQPSPELGISTRNAIALSTLIVVSVGAVDQLVRVQQEAAYWTFMLVAPRDPSIPNMGQLSAIGSARTFSTLLIWGTLLSLVILISGIVIWRSTRSGARHPLLVWTTRLGVAAALAGAVWHAGVANWYANTFDNLFTQVQQAMQRSESRR